MARHTGLIIICVCFSLSFIFTAEIGTNEDQTLAEIKSMDAEEGMNPDSVHCSDPTPTHGNFTEIAGSCHPFFYMGCEIEVTCDKGFAFHDGSHVVNVTCEPFPDPCMCKEGWQNMAGIPDLHCTEIYNKIQLPSIPQRKETEENTAHGQESTEVVDKVTEKERRTETIEELYNTVEHPSPLVGPDVTIIGVGRNTPVTDTGEYAVLDKENEVASEIINTEEGKETSTVNYEGEKVLRVDTESSEGTGIYDEKDTNNIPKFSSTNDIDITLENQNSDLEESAADIDNEIEPENIENSIHEQTETDLHEQATDSVDVYVGNNEIDEEITDKNEETVQESAHVELEHEIEDDTDPEEDVLSNEVENADRLNVVDNNANDEDDEHGDVFEDETEDDTVLIPFEPDEDILSNEVEDIEGLSIVDTNEQDDEFVGVETGLQSEEIDVVKGMDDEVNIREQEVDNESFEDYETESYDDVDVSDTDSTYGQQQDEIEEVGIGQLSEPPLVEENESELDEYSEMGEETETTLTEEKDPIDISEAESELGDDGVDDTINYEEDPEKINEIYGSVESEEGDETNNDYEIETNGDEDIHFKDMGNIYKEFTEHNNKFGEDLDVENPNVHDEELEFERERKDEEEDNEEPHEPMADIHDKQERTEPVEPPPPGNLLPGTFVPHADPSLVFPPERTNNICSLPAKTGPCKAAFHRYYYNSRTGECHIFVYGGCRGNANNFKTLDECVQTCSNSSESSLH